MFLKFVIFLIVFIILVRVISNLFLSGSKKNSKARFFYQIFKNVREQQKNQPNQSQDDPNKSVEGNFDNIEEAEFEDITEDEDAKTSSKDDE